MLCGAARGTIIVTTAVAPTATGTIRTTGTTISDFVAPVLKLCGAIPARSRNRFLHGESERVYFESRPCSGVG